MLAIAGSLAGKKHRAGQLRHAADAHAAVRRAAGRRRDLIVGALTFIPALALGPIVEHLHAMIATPDRCDARMPWTRRPHDATNAKARPLFDPPIVQRAIGRCVPQARPAASDAQPGDVRRLRRQHPDHGAVASVARGPGEAPPGFILARLASGSGSRCCSPTSPRRWPKGAARPRPTRCARRARTRRPRSSPSRSTAPTHQTVSRRDAAQGRRRARRGRRRHSRSTAKSIEGVASVDEVAITGESAPVIRESGGDRSSVTGGTRVLSDWLVVRISVNPGETFSTA